MPGLGDQRVPQPVPLDVDRVTAAHVGVPARGRRDDRTHQLEGVLGHRPKDGFRPALAVRVLDEPAARHPPSQVERVSQHVEGVAEAAVLGTNGLVQGDELGDSGGAGAGHVVERDETAHRPVDDLTYRKAVRVVGDVRVVRQPGAYGLLHLVDDGRHLPQQHPAHLARERIGVLCVREGQGASRGFPWG